MTRVLLCANNIDEVGGAQRVAHVLAGGLQARGHDVELVGVTPFEPRHDFGGAYPRTVLMSKPWPAKSIQTERVRNQLRAEAVSRMVELTKGADQPSVIVTAQVWAMEIVGDALAALAPAVRARWSVIGQYHGSFAAAASGRDLARILRSYASASVFTALTGEDADAFIRAGLNNVRVMPNPLAFWPDLPVDRTGVDARVLLYLGRLSHEKGVDLLVDAWSLISDRHPTWTLRIVGDGPQSEELVAQARGLAGADRIEWWGATIDPQAALMDSDLVVLPSRTEGLPLVVAEALACALPVVATDCSSGVRVLVGEGEHAGGVEAGTLVHRGDSRALATALDAAMADAQWRHDRGHQGRVRMERYRLDSILDEWERLIGRVLL